MPKLSDIEIDISRFRGRGIRPWTDPTVVKPENGLTKKEDELKTPQIVSKQISNGEQTGSKTLANGNQIDSEQLANSNQTVSKKLAKQIANNRYIDIIQTTTPKDEKRGALFGKSKNIYIEKLAGKEKELVTFLFLKCRDNASLITPDITANELKSVLNISNNRLKNLVHRVLSKGVIERETLKCGRAGWRKFKFFKEIYQYINDSYSLKDESIEKRVAKQIAGFSSSSNDILNTTTTGEIKNSQLTDLNIEWQSIDVEPLSLIGFTKTHLFQIASQNKLSPKIVQDSIYAFAFDLQENSKEKSIKGDPINFFMGILRSGRVYLPPSNYESPQDKSIRLYKEKMKNIEQKRVAIEKEAFNLAFNDWFYKLTDEQKKELLPKIFRNNATSEKLEKSKILESSARSHFEKEIWPKLKQDIENNKLNIDE